MSNGALCPSSRVFVAGHRGLVGSAILRLLQLQGFQNLITRSRSELDLTDRSAVYRFFATERPEYIFLAAAKVGGIRANDRYPADFIRENLAIQLNVIEAAHQAEAAKLLFLGSSCIYPKESPQPISEDALLTGPLEFTNESYAIAKIAGIKMCQAYRRQHGFDAVALMPTNLYGPGDNFDLETSHVLPALIRKVHDARMRGNTEIEVWGSGKPRREFLHVDDLANACLFAMKNFSGAEILNVGWGRDISIAELARLIFDALDFDGDLVFDASQPDGTMLKRLDTSRMLKLGWEPKISLREGILSTYKWFLSNYS